MKNFVKRAVAAVLSQVAPDFYESLKARRARAHSQRLEKQWGCTALTKKLIEQDGATVSRGPFQGMQFVSQTFERHLAPKLLGTYEMELHPVWEHVLGKRYEQVIDIGCAEGYYAVGLASRFPSSTVYAFDIDSWARNVTRQMAMANDAVNLHVQGACDTDWLTKHLQPGAFVLSDCEGFEDQLFHPEAVPSMASCDLLIELHENPAPGVTERLKERFSRTHEQQLIFKQERRLEDLPNLSFLDELTEKEQRLALREHRGNNHRWLFLEPRDR